MYDETYYTHTLKNGLRVYIFHKPEFKTTCCSFGTPYGALKIHEKLKGKEYHFNPGIAHFLEHKLFESKGDDIMNEFSSMGANVNAFTSYKETVYYFTIADKKISKPLNLLLDFVQDFKVSEESVEKEKGIILQEVMMYDEMPDSKLFNESLKCIYHHYPLKYDIGGDKKSIYAITKEELELCYKINYHPSNMVVCVTSPIQPEKIMDIIIKNQEKKKFKKMERPSLSNKEEPDEVVKKKHSFKANVQNNKHALIYKIKPNFVDAYDAIKQELCMKFLLEAHFSSINPKYQEWLDKKIINDYFFFEVEFDKNFAFIVFFIENDDSKTLKKLINNSLKKKLLTKEVLEQIKRRYIGNSFEPFNDLESFNNMFIRDAVNDFDTFKAIDILKSITLEDVENTYKSLSFQHFSTISLLKNER